MKVIISDVESRKSFDVVNIIKNLYRYECILCARKDYKFQLPIIYGKSIHPLNNLSYESFAKDLIAIIEKYRDEELIYLPVSERTTRFFYKFLQENACRNMHYLLPGIEYFDLTSDKVRFQAYCMKAGLPVPGSYTKEDIPFLREHLRPLILKPRKGEGSVGIRYISNEAELDALNNVEFDQYILQDKLNNSVQVEGGFFLCKDGLVLNSYTHRRLRTFPQEGGVTIYSESTNNKPITEIGKSLLKELNWNGLAMIEFLYDESTGEWKIIELNPRIWGSILLSGFIGADLLKDYIRLSMGDNLDAPHAQKEGNIRWIYPFDFLNLFKGKITIREFFNLNSRPTCYVNFTYGCWLSSLSYLVYFSINKSSIKRFFKKIRKR